MNDYYRFPLAPECIPFVLGLVIISIIGVYFDLKIIWVFACLCVIFVLFFFRNPRRDISLDSDSIVAPADGLVIDIENGISSDIIGDTRVDRIAIFMSIWNVHVNRMPIDGTVSKIIDKKGVYLDTRNQASSDQNRSKSMIILTKYGKILLKQVAGLIARQIVNQLKVGDKVKQGKPFGMVRFGSKVEVIFPSEGALILVKKGDKTTAGVTILARYNMEQKK